MPHLTIQNAIDYATEIEKRITERLNNLENKINQTKKCSCDVIDSGKEIDTLKLSQDIIELRRELISHITIYNRHIIQQHSKQ